MTNGKDTLVYLQSPTRGGACELGPKRPTCGQDSPDAAMVGYVTQALQAQRMAISV